MFPIRVYSLCLKTFGLWAFIVVFWFVLVGGFSEYSNHFLSPSTPTNIDFIVTQIETKIIYKKTE